MAAVSSLPSRLHAGSGAMSSPRNAVGRLPPVAERPSTNQQTDNARSASPGVALTLIDAAAKQRLDRALWSAAAAGNVAVARKTLRSGAAPGSVCDGFPSLCVATVGGHVEVVALLCEEGADPNQVVQAAGEVHGATPMYLAAHGGQASIVRLLVKFGGDIETPLPQNSCTPLYMAADIGHVETVRALVAAGANLDRANAGGASAACIAARNGHGETLAVLASAGANLDATMDNGAGPAHLAALSGRSESLVVLHTLGANVQKAAVVGGQEMTPIALAAQFGQAAAVTSLRECISVSNLIVMLQARIRGKRKRNELKKLEEQAREQVDEELKQAVEEKRRFNEMVEKTIFIQKVIRGALGRRRMHERVAERRREELAVVKIQAGRRGQLGRRGASIVRSEIDALTQQQIDAIEHEITTALKTERDDRETKLARELESYRAARDAQMEARRNRIEETVGPRPLLPVHVDYESAAARTIQSRFRGNAGRQMAAQRRGQVVEAQIAKQFDATLVIGKMWRGWQARKLMKQHDTELRDFEAAQQKLAQEALAALLEEKIELLRQLLSGIEEIDRVVQADRGRSLLHVAAGRTLLPAVEAILLEGASVSVQDGDGQTPLSIAEAKVFFHRSRGARNAAAMDNATRVFHMLELAVEADHDQHQPQGTLLEMVGTEEEARGLCAPQYGSRNVWKYSPTQHMEEANVNVQQYVAEVRAATEAEDAAQENNGGVSLPKGDQTARARTQQLVSDGNCDVLRIHQLSESERATEMNISMRLQAEAAEEENAINACTSPLQASGLLSDLMASAVSAAEDADQSLELNQYVGHDYKHEAEPSARLIARPPSSSPPRAGNGRPLVSSRGRPTRHEQPPVPSGAAPQAMAVHPGQSTAPNALPPFAPAQAALGVAMVPAPAYVLPIEELSTMSVKQLRERAASNGVSDSQIEEARDSDDPRGELVKLISGQQTPAGPTRGATGPGH